MPKPVIAVYPGTFDPMTLGHSDVVRRAAQLFDQVIVAVAAAHHKKTMFSLDERIDMAREVVKAEDVIDYTPRENVAERLAKRFGAAVGHGAVRALREWAPVR